jgi:hypothetical protein
VPLARRLRDAAVALVAVLAVLGVGLLAFGNRREPPSRPQPGDVLLALDDLALDPRGTSRRFRMRRPGRVEVAVSPAGGEEAEVRVSFGFPEPPRPDGQDIPRDPRAWTARSGDAPRTFPVFATGLYVLRVEPTSSPPPASASVRVRALPPEAP